MVCFAQLAPRVLQYILLYNSSYLLYLILYRAFVESIEECRQAMIERRKDSKLYSDDMLGAHGKLLQLWLRELVAKDNDFVERELIYANVNNAVFGCAEILYNYLSYILDPAMLGDFLWSIQKVISVSLISVMINAH